MNPHRAYREQQAVGMPRIDRVLALYAGAIERTEQSLQEPDPEKATALRARARLIVSGLMAGVNPDGGPLAANVLRLCEFVAHALESGTAGPVRAALDVLRTLHEAYAAVRPEALELERSGQIAPVEDTVAVRAVV